ncbi:hypothetical protein OA46_02085 [Enterobacter cloacae]|nr:hypothetical protein OA46_02085 [Enterobacter cloacae]
MSKDAQDHREGFYCLYCQRMIKPEVGDDGEIIALNDGMDTFYVYVHDDVEHDNDFSFTQIH